MRQFVVVVDPIVTDADVLAILGVILQGGNVTALERTERGTRIGVGNSVFSSCARFFEFMGANLIPDHVIENVTVREF